LVSAWERLWPRPRLRLLMIHDCLIMNLRAQCCLSKTEIQRASESFRELQRAVNRLARQHPRLLYFLFSLLLALNTPSSRSQMSIRNVTKLSIHVRDHHRYRLAWASRALRLQWAPHHSLSWLSPARVSRHRFGVGTLYVQRLSG